MEDPPAKVTSDLLELVRGGDEQASDRLVELLYPAVVGKVRYHVRRQADHEDIVQEIFMKLFLKLDQYKGVQPFEHWVARMSVTTCIDWLRKGKARPLVTFADLSENEAAVLQNSLQGKGGGGLEAHREVLDGLLSKLIDALKPNEQVVIRLLDLGELSVREVMEQTGWSASKVKTLAMRARRKLAAHLRRLEGSSDF